jgi:hypothetical protein
MTRSSAVAAHFLRSLFTRDLSGVLIPEGQTERIILLKVRK